MLLYTVLFHPASSVIAGFCHCRGRCCRCRCFVFHVFRFVFCLLFLSLCLFIYTSKFSKTFSSVPCADRVIRKCGMVCMCVSECVCVCMCVSGWGWGWEGGGVMYYLHIKIVTAE